MSPHGRGADRGGRVLVELIAEQEAQRQEARERLAAALDSVRTAELELRQWAPLSIMNSLTTLEAELQTILARL